MNDYTALALGILSAGIGGELFVRGIVGIARWARVSPGIVALTVAAFATSSPELAVAVTGALAGRPEISLGDALGSNVANVSLILALVALPSGVALRRESVRRDFPIALAAPLLVGVLAFDGQLSRVDGVLLLAVFAGWLIAVVFVARGQRGAAAQVLGERRPWLVIVSCGLGVIWLVVAGRLMVSAARGIAGSFGIDEFVIGATVVAFGTSVPELATALIAKLRGHGEVGPSTILGSNIFNGLFVVAVSALIRPIPIDLRDISIALLFGVAAIGLALPSRRERVEPWRGLVLLALYAGYLAAILSGGLGSRG